MKNLNNGWKRLIAAILCILIILFVTYVLPSWFRNLRSWSSQSQEALTNGPTATTKPAATTKPTCDSVKYKITNIMNDTEYYVTKSGTFSTNSTLAGLFDKDELGYYIIINNNKNYLGVSQSSSNTSIGMYNGNSKNLLATGDKMYYSANDAQGIKVKYYVHRNTDVTVFSDTNIDATTNGKWTIKTVCL